MPPCHHINICFLPPPPRHRPPPQPASDVARTPTYLSPLFYVFAPFLIPWPLAQSFLCRLASAAILVPPPWRIFVKNLAQPSSLCINWRLYNIASVRAVSISKAEKRCSVLIDSLICGLFPIVYTAIQYIVQGHHYNIFEDIGCYPDLYNTIPTYFISRIWPIIIGLISAVYCQHLYHHLALLPAHGARDDRAVLHHAARALFTIYLNAVVTPIGPWISWADTHFDYERPVPVTSIALDAYAPSPTSSSFTDVKRPASTDTESFMGLKCAESFVSTTPTSASSYTSSSRFVEHAHRTRSSSARTRSSESPLMLPLPLIYVSPFASSLLLNLPAPCSLTPLYYVTQLLHADAIVRRASSHAAKIRTSPQEDD
ncbi:pheromone A receptor-domain-containing protein [Mycena rebaudengoi]|nr:pheromone A receptor-domain-containing protein [Mycena rebaudengoi]